MPVPNPIPVRYTEDEADYVSVRRVVRQQFTFPELVDMILRGTGKQPQRIREILRAGTIVHNMYRYWWDGFEPDEATLAAVLEEFPDPDPARPFRSEDCLWVRFSDSTEPLPRTTTIKRQEALERRWAGWSRRPAFWDYLMEFARGRQPVYSDYSYYLRADIYRAELTAQDRSFLRGGMGRLATRKLRARLLADRDWVALEFGCPRAASPAAPKTT